MSADVVLEVSLGSEGLAAIRVTALVRPLPRVNANMRLQIALLRKRLIAILMRAFKRPFSSLLCGIVIYVSSCVDGQSPDP